MRLELGALASQTKTSTSNHLALFGKTLLLAEISAVSTFDGILGMTKNSLWNDAWIPNNKPPSHSISGPLGERDLALRVNDIIVNHSCTVVEPEFSTRDSKLKKRKHTN